MKEISYTTFSKMVLFFLFLPVLKYTRWSFPLLTSCWGMSDPSFPIKRVRSGWSFKPDLQHSQLSDMAGPLSASLPAWGTHCASPQRDSSRSDSGGEQASVLAPGSGLAQCLGDMLGDVNLQEIQLQEVSLTFPCLAGPPSLSPTSSFSSCDFLGHHWLSTFIAFFFFFNGLTD